MIGGPRAVVEIDLSLAAVKVAATVAKTLGRTIHDDDGNEKPWKIYAPNRSGGFAPIPVSATLEAAARAIQKKIDSGADAGFAGPGEHEGSAYSFRIRLFVPSPPPPIHVIETPTVSDDEVIDLTNLDGDDDLESVRRNPERSVTRKRRVRGDGPRDDGKGEKTRKGKKGIGKRKRKRRKPAADKEAVVADDQPSSEEPVPEQPAEEQPAEDEPAEEQPAEEQHA